MKEKMGRRKERKERKGEDFDDNIDNQWLHTGSKIITLDMK